MAQESTYPKRYKFTDVQKKWIDYWKKEKIYSFNPKKRGKVFTMDTPPPFVSGTLHLGHVLNHSWIDFVARYNKMKGKNVYFPQGFDCHGLPVELAVEKNYGVSKYDRDEFLAKCHEWVEKNINNMTKQFDDLGYSTDWNHTYRTMNDNYKYKVQWSLLYFYKQGWLYREKFPTHFCVNCETSVAKAEVSYQDEHGKLWFLKLPIVGRNNGEHITIATTRPEYLEACVGVFIHPNDERYYHLSAAEIEIPFTNRTVRVETDSNVDMNFGTGIVYCCTYGDETDIKWKLEYNLDEIQIFTEDGHMNENSRYKGMTILEAREQIVKDLEDAGYLEDIKNHDHRIVVHSERSSCRKPIEFLPVYQWFINVKDFTEEIIESGEAMKWYPEKHKQRLIDWCKGLDWNWVISRQRVFGTPIPFWYCVKCGEIIPPNEKDLPLDPLKTPPPINECPKCKSKNLKGEKDICDCWIDSSITPLAIAKWLEDEDFFKKAYTNALVHRPQGYEIIRTWLFYTLFRCKKLTDKAPFAETMINGMVAGPDGRKMSKSFGNIVSPDEVMPEFGADAIRQWAAMGSLGDDYPFEYTWINIQSKQPVKEEVILKEMKNLPPKKFNNKYRRNYEQLTGASRLLTKVWNAYRLMKMNLDKVNLKEINLGEMNMNSIDHYIYSEFNKKLEAITRYFDEYNWHEGFALLRPFFWNEVCDNYIEAIKYRLNAEEEETRQTSLKIALNLFFNLLKIFAIFMPFITEEIHSIMFQQFTGLKSIHLDKWPKAYDNLSDERALEGNEALSVIKELRSIKSSLKIPLGEDVSRVIIFVKKDRIVGLENMKIDIKKTIRIDKLDVMDPSKEKTIKQEPDLKKVVEELEMTLYFYK